MLSRSLINDAPEGNMSMITLLSSSTNCVVFELILSDIPCSINVSIGSVVAISNVKKVCGPSNGNDMIMHLPALIELNVVIVVKYAKHHICRICRQ